MRQRLVCAFLFSTSLTNAIACDIPEPFKLLKPKEAQPFNTASLSSITKDKNANTTHPELINFWATWCAPCRKELPFLQALNENSTAAVTLINIEDEPAEAEKVLDELNIHKLSTQYQMMEILDTLNIQGLPSSVLFHKNDVYLGVGVLKNEQAISDWLLCLQKLQSE